MNRAEYTISSKNALRYIAAVLLLVTISMKRVSEA